MTDKEVDKKIRVLEDQQCDIQEELDKLYSSKQNNNSEYRDSLVSKCFRCIDKGNYVKILRKAKGTNEFIAFEFDTDFNDNCDFNTSNNFDYRELYISDSEYFEGYEEITEKEYATAFSSLIAYIKIHVFKA